MKSMLKTIFGAALLFSLVPGVSLAEGDKVHQVVVFADRAEVTRALTVSCPGGGEVDAEFARLPRGLDERTLRAEARGKAKALGVKSRVIPLEEDADERVRALREALRKVDDEIAARDDEARTISDRRRRSAGYAGYFVDLWGEEVRNPKPDTRRWARVLDGLREDEQAAAREIVALGPKRRELSRQRDLLQRRLAHYRPSTAAEARTARVVVDCNGLSSVRVHLSYVVPGATWTPEYDLRFVPSGKGRVGQGRAILTVAAAIQQATGEDWVDAKILLSTAKPRLGARAPRPAALKIDGYEAGEEKLLVSGVERRKDLKAGGGGGAAGPAGADLDDRGQSMILTLPHRATIHADGRPYWLPVDVVKTKAKAGYVTVPKLRPYVFQAVAFKNPARYPLLAGRIHVHRGGTYVGDTRTEYRAPGEHMELSLGIDEELKVERTDLVEKNRRAGIFSKTKHMDRAYRVELESRATRAVEVEVRENIPVSKVADVKVKLDKKKSTKGYEHDSHRGFVTWRVRLKPGEKKHVDLSYEIHLPEDWKTRR